MKYLKQLRAIGIFCLSTTCSIPFFSGMAVSQDFSYERLLQERAPWTATNSSRVVKARLPELAASQQLSVITYLHVLGEESGRKTGKHFFLVAETARRAHYSGVPKKEIDDWLDAAAKDFNSDGQFSQAYYWGRSFLDKEDVGTAAEAIKDVGALAGGKVGAGVALGGTFLEVVNETGALDWIASSTLVPYGTLDAHTPRNLDLDVSKWNTFNLTNNVIDAAQNNEYREILEGAARRFSLTSASLTDSVGEILSTSPSLRASYENMATMELLEGLANADTDLSAAIDSMGASVEQLISDYANGFDASLDVLVQEASSQKQRRERQGEYQKAVWEHRQTFAGANLALNAASLFSDSPDLQKIGTAVGVIEEFSQSGIDMAFGNISPLEMANVYVAGAKVLMNLMSSGGQSFEGAVMEALAQISEKLAEIHEDLNDLRIENREAHQLTHDLLIDLHEKFALHRQWSEMSAEEIDSSIRIVSAQISTANERIEKLNDEVRAGFYQLVELGKKKDFGRCVRKREELPPAGMISSREFKECVEDITSWIFDTGNLVSDGPISNVGTVEEPSVLIAELRSNLALDGRDFVLPSTRRDIWLTSSHAYIKFLRDWPEFHVPGRVTDANQRYLSEAVIANIVTRGEALGRFPSMLLGFSKSGTKVSFDHSTINDLTGVVVERSSTHTSQVAAEMRSRVSELSYGIDPFASTENESYSFDLTKPIKTTEIALALDRTGFGNLSVESCFKPDGKLHAFRFDTPVASTLPSALLLLGIEGRVGLNACIDFSEFTSPGSVLFRCPPPPPPRDRFGNQLIEPSFEGSDDFLINPVYRGPTISPPPTEVGWWSDQGGKPNYNPGERPGGYCSTVRDDYAKPFMGTEDGSDENYLYGTRQAVWVNELGGVVSVRFSATHESEDSGNYSAIFSKDAPPRSFREPITGNWNTDLFKREFAHFRSVVFKHVQAILDAAETVSPTSEASTDLYAASCEVRSALQRRLLGAALQAQEATGSTSANAALVASKARTSLSHILWTGAIAPVIPSLGASERAQISEDLRWIANTSPIDGAILDEISSSECRGHVLLGRAGEMNIEAQILGEYKDQLEQRVDQIISMLEEAEVNDDFEIPDRKVARTLDELLKVQDWVVTSASIN